MTTKSKFNICFSPYTVIVSEDRADEARAIWDGLDEYESHTVIRAAFRDAGFEVIDEREDDAKAEGNAAPPLCR